MIVFTTTLLRFNSNGDKTGWTYVEISQKHATQLKSDTKVSFRVKGLLDSFPIQKVAILPMGEGKFILPFNSAMRKGTGKKFGDKIKVELEPDERVLVLSPAFVKCLKDDPRAFDFFKTLPKSHQSYFSKWIESAKTSTTKTNRIAMAVIALGQQQGYGEMMRANKKSKG